jgi:thioredoxin 2
MATRSAAQAPASVVTCPSCARRNRVRATPAGVPSCGGCGRPLPWLVEAGEDGFEQEIRSSVPVIVDLWAPWCGPCRLVAPVLERLAQQRAGHLKVVKLDVDRSPGVAARYGARSIPLLLLVREGREVGRLGGAQPQGAIEAWLDGGD